jgi:hypothetical protein
MMRRRVDTSGATINGFGRGGEIETKATIPLVHFRKTPVTKITASFANAADVRLRVEGGASAGSGGIDTLMLDKPAASGETVILHIENKGPPAAILSYIVLS